MPDSELPKSVHLTAAFDGDASKTALPELPRPHHRLRWDAVNAAYKVSDPHVGTMDVYSAEQMRAYALAACEASAGSAIPAASPEVRMLMPGEAYACALKPYSLYELADRLQRKFCEVNGIALAAGSALPLPDGAETPVEVSEPALIFQALDAAAQTILGEETRNNVREFLARAWHHNVMPALNAARGVKTDGGTSK